MVRLPDGMRGRITSSANANNRSMNAEIVARIEQSYKGVESSSVTQENVERLYGQMQALFLSGQNPSYHELSFAVGLMVRRAKELVRPGDGPGIHALPGLLAALGAAVDDVEAVLRTHGVDHARN